MQTSVSFACRVYAATSSHAESACSPSSHLPVGVVDDRIAGGCFGRSAGAQARVVVSQRTLHHLVVTRGGIHGADALAQLARGGAGALPVRDQLASGDMPLSLHMLTVEGPRGPPHVVHSNHIVRRLFNPIQVSPEGCRHVFKPKVLEKQANVTFPGGLCTLVLDAFSDLPSSWLTAAVMPRGCDSTCLSFCGTKYAMPSARRTACTIVRWRFAARSTYAFTDARRVVLSVVASSPLLLAWAREPAYSRFSRVSRRFAVHMVDRAPRTKIFGNCDPVRESNVVFTSVNAHATVTAIPLPDLRPRAGSGSSRRETCGFDPPSRHRNSGRRKPSAGMHSVQTFHHEVRIVPFHTGSSDWTHFSFTLDAPLVCVIDRERTPRVDADALRISIVVETFFAAGHEEELVPGLNFPRTCQARPQPGLCLTVAPSCAGR